MECGGNTMILMLYETLQGAVSQNPEVLKPAEQKLASWENQDGFYSALMRIIANHSLETSARYIAAIYLKNGVEKFWRKNLVIYVGIGDEEKVEIRKILEQVILIEPVNNIALQLAIMISKISRLDVPREWPTLLPHLMESIRIEDPNKQLRALLATYHVVKILATKRLTGDRKIFQDMSSEIYDYLCSLWDSLFLQWASSGACGDELQRAHYALKILRILTVRGYKVPHESQSVINIIPIIMKRAKITLELRTSRQDSSVLLEKHVVVMWKIISDLLEIHPLSFVPFLRAGLEFACYFGFSEDGRSAIVGCERVAILALNLLKSIMLCPEFRAPKNFDGEIEQPTDCRRRLSSSTDTDPLTYEASKIKDEFFSNETLDIIVRILVTRYLPLTPVELQSWKDDPEEFTLRMDETGETWKYNLRQSAETLFVTLFKEYRKSSEIFLSIMKDFQAPLNDPTDSNAILAKDALYNGAGLVAFELYDLFSFDDWLSSTLIHELSLPVDILHRRIVWLVGQWTGVKILPESRPIIFHLLLNGLKSTDVVVRMCSAQALKSCLDDFDFVPEQFVPFMNDTFHFLFTLLREVKESDNKMRILHTMSFLIERMGPQIKSSLQITSLPQYLPILWETQHNMLKAAVLSTAIQLVHALGTESSVLREFFFPVVRFATDLKNPEHVYLLEDGLDLWFTFMEYTSDPPDESYISLVDNLIPLLEISTEHLKVAVALVNSYAIIYPERFTERFGAMVCKELNTSIQDMRAEGVAMAVRCVETLLRTSPNQGPNAVKPIMGKIFVSAVEGIDTPILMSLYLSVVSRILLISEPMFQLGIEHVASEEGKLPDQVLGTLVDVMCKKLSYVVQLERKKLISIALLKLMSFSQPVILHRICGIFLGVCETINDILKTDSNGKNIDSLCFIDFDASRENEEIVTENDLRKKVLASRDVVYNVDLVQLFRNEVNSLRMRLGEIQFTDIMSTIDVETMQMARGFLE